MAGGDDDGNAPRHMLQHRMHHRFALGIGQHELLGEIGEDADAVRAGIDHEIDAAALPLQVQFPAIVEDGRGNREDTAIGPSGWD